MKKKLSHEIIIHKNDRNFAYIKEIQGISRSNTTKTLNSIDKITKRFFKEAFNLKNSTGYSKLEKIFKEKKNRKIEKFCKIINKELYSKTKPKKEQNEFLISLLINIVKNNHILGTEENSLKNEKIKPSSKNIKISGIDKKKLNQKNNNSKKK